MKKSLRLLSLALLALALVALAGCSSSTPAAAPSSSTSAPAAGAAVSITNFTFDPADITVKPGGAVTWTNNDSVAHTITGNAGEFDSGSVAPGATYSHTFDKAGSFSYHCTVHPSMTAKVTVQ